MIIDLGDTPLEVDRRRRSRSACFCFTTNLHGEEIDARVEARKYSSNHGVLKMEWSSLSEPKYAQTSTHTYLLRSIVYDTQRSYSSRFAVVSVNDDGRLTIAWKILKEYRTNEINTRPSLKSLQINGLSSNRPEVAPADL